MQFAPFRVPTDAIVHNQICQGCFKQKPQNEEEVFRRQGVSPARSVEAVAIKSLPNLQNTTCSNEAQKEWVSLPWVQVIIVLAIS